MSMQLAQAGLNFFVAACLGAAIGLERHWRQRLAGLRTNTLVALGAAIYVTYSRVVFDHAGGSGDRRQHCAQADRARHQSSTDRYERGGAALPGLHRLPRRAGFGDQVAAR